MNLYVLAQNKYFVVLWFCGFVVLWFCGFVVLWDEFSIAYQGISEQIGQFFSFGI